MRIEKINFTQELNFLKSEHYVSFTETGTQALANDENIVEAGTIYPANDATAVGIVLHDVDVSGGDQPIAVMVEGHVYADRLPVAASEAAKTALKNIGFY